MTLDPQGALPGSDVRDTLSSQGDLDHRPEEWDAVMTSYGYRLFSMQLTQGSSTKAVDFSKCNGEHFVNIAKRLLETLKDTAVGDPDRSSEDNPSLVEDPLNLGHFGESALQVLELTSVDYMIRGHAFAGIVGQHDRALAVPGVNQDIDMRNHAAAREHRFILVFPESGDMGVAVMETIGRSCPIGSLQKWMAKRSRSDAFLRETQIKEETGRQRSVPWWRLRFRQMTDEARLRELLSNGKLEKIELTKKQVLPDRKRETEIFRLVSTSIEKTVVDQVSRILSGWFQQDRHVTENLDHTVTSREGASQLATIFGDEVNNLDFDDGWIVIRDEGGQKRVSPDRMPDVFTYIIGQSPSTDDEIYRRAGHKFLQLRQSSQIDLEWPPLSPETEI
jgi:hypothetical protein